MGLLSDGHPLSWEETKSLANHVRQHGIVQFINLYKKLKDKTGDVLKFGDEVEYVIVKFDHENKMAKLRLCAPELLMKLTEQELNHPLDLKSLWRPEYAAYMIEGTPGTPYGGFLSHFNGIEVNMKYRRRVVHELLQPDERLMTITSFPRLGCPAFSWPITEPTPDSGASRSLFFPDEAIYPGHPRFVTLTKNIRQRRGKKVAINLPLYKDVNTEWPFVENFGPYAEKSHDTKNDAKPNHVYLDAMGFGMGCSCLQVTFQACCVEEARILHDQLTPLCPIMLAMTASSPIFRGYLTDVDCRWSVISGSVDCRTDEERGLIPLKNNQFVIPKSRYDSVDCYISKSGEICNDIQVVYSDDIYNTLRNAGIDHLLAQHVSHLFIRDTVSLFSEKINQNDEEDTDHFENIQSTNWQSMRFKPPPPNSDIGWRVEFRPCELQFTDFENAAVVCFIVLTTRLILSYGLEMVIPISLVDENMRTAQKKDAILKEKFWFRRNINLSAKYCNNSDYCDLENEPTDACGRKIPNCVLLTLDEIINGKEGVFPGLIPLLDTYLSNMDVDADTHCTIKQYLSYIRRKASGQTMTAAAWMRKFVREHPSYNFDSIVTERINYDMLWTVNKIQEGEISCPELLTRSSSKHLDSEENIPEGVCKVFATDAQVEKRQ